MYLYNVFNEYAIENMYIYIIMIELNRVWHLCVVPIHYSNWRPIRVNVSVIIRVLNIMLTHLRYVLARACVLMTISLGLIEYPRGARVLKYQMCHTTKHHRDVTIIFLYNVYTLLYCVYDAPRMSLKVNVVYNIMNAIHVYGWYKYRTVREFSISWR